MPIAGLIRRMTIASIRIDVLIAMLRRSARQFNDVGALVGKLNLPFNLLPSA